jgi:hypothetical protein
MTMFENLNGAKLASKRVKAALSVTASQANELTARAAGYRDWHHLTTTVGTAQAPAAGVSEAQRVRLANFMGKNSLTDLDPDDVMQLIQPEEAVPNERPQDPIRTEVLSVKSKIEHLIEGLDIPQDILAAVLIEVGFELGTKPYRMQTSDAEARRIRGTYPDASRESIARLRVDERGLVQATAYATTMLIRHVDHDPDANSWADVQADQALGPPSDEVAGAFSRARQLVRKSGMSAYGATAMGAYAAIVGGQKEGVKPVQLLKTLLEVMRQAIKTPTQIVEQEPTDDELAELLAAQMGMSKAAAMKYVKAARRQGKI